jgi:hypothetical protein
MHGCKPTAADGGTRLLLRWDLFAERHSWDEIPYIGFHQVRFLIDQKQRISEVFICRRGLWAFVELANRLVVHFIYFLNASEICRFKNNELSLFSVGVDPLCSGQILAEDAFALLPFDDFTQEFFKLVLWELDGFVAVSVITSVFICFFAMQTWINLRLFPFTALWMQTSFVWLWVLCCQHWQAVYQPMLRIRQLLLRNLMMWFSLDNVLLLIALHKVAVNIVEDLHGKLFF